MAAPSRSSASWERVLAAMEAEAARAAALLVSDDLFASAGIEYDGHDASPAASPTADDAAGVPATWRLPAPASGASGAAGAQGLTGSAAARAVAGYAAAATGTASAIGTAATAGPSAGSNADPKTAPNPAEATAPSDSDDLELPDPADLPPLSPEQQERFAALHARITVLQAELAAAMAEAETVLARPITRRPNPQPRPELVDRRL